LYDYLTTNKIVSRLGILESLEAYDGTATLKTENLLWDAQTAEVLLTSVGCIINCRFL